MKRRKTLIDFIDLYYLDTETVEEIEKACAELDALNKAEPTENGPDWIKAKRMLENFVSNPDPETESRLILLITMGISQVSK